MDNLTLYLIGIVGFVAVLGLLEMISKGDKTLIIVRDKSQEDWLIGEVRDNWGSEAREGIHLTDLLTPLRAYWQRIKPLKPTREEILYWIAGKGHEGGLQRATGYSHGEVREYEGIKYTPDFLHNFPVEFKTRRRGLAKEGSEAEDYDWYLRQLRGYCALENSTQGWLQVLSLVEKTGAYKTKPELACYRVEFTTEELQAERYRLIDIKQQLNHAIFLEHPATLPYCPAWMCGSQMASIVVMPRCLICEKDFKTDYGLNKHHMASQKKGKEHTIKPATYKYEFESRCKWHEDCCNLMGSWWRITKQEERKGDNKS